MDWGAYLMSELGLFSLERRRMRGDLIEVYKMMRGNDCVGSQRLFPRAEMASMREHSFKVLGNGYRGDVRGKFFFNSESGECVEWAAGNGGGGDRYDRVF